MDAINAPNEIKTWLECLAWFIMIVAGIAHLVHLARGKEAQPANEILGYTVKEHDRRINHLDSENTKVWVQMEANRMEGRDRIAESDKLIASLEATIEGLTNSVNLLTLEVHNSRKK